MVCDDLIIMMSPAISTTTTTTTTTTTGVVLFMVESEASPAVLGFQGESAWVYDDYDHGGIVRGRE